MERHDFGFFAQSEAVKAQLLAFFQSDEVSALLALFLSKVISFGIIWSVNKVLVSHPDFNIVETGSCITEAVSTFDIDKTALTINHVNGTMSIPVTSLGSIVFISYALLLSHPNIFANATNTSINPNMT